MQVLRIALLLMVAAFSTLTLTGCGNDTTPVEAENPTELPEGGPSKEGLPTAGPIGTDKK